jgi:hypothetical protein
MGAETGIMGAEGGVWVLKCSNVGAKSKSTSFA